MISYTYESSIEISGSEDFNETPIPKKIQASNK